MAHLHNVHDTDAHFLINLKTRVITKSDFSKMVLVQGDHNSERVTFELDRFIEGHDLSDCTSVRVQYNNIGSLGKISKGIYEVNDLKVSDESDELVTFTWLISSNATKYDGQLNFLIQFICTGDDGSVEYKWHTDINQDTIIKKGIDNGDATVETYTDILEQWKQIFIENGGGAPAKIGDVTLLANKWLGAQSPYSQVVNIDGVTKNSQVDLTPNVEQLSIFWEKDLTFVTENENGVVTVYAIGQKPTQDYTIQVTITEVEYE